MHKHLYISLLLIFFLMAASAQKKYIYQDTSLLQKEETYNDDENETAGDYIPSMAIDTFLRKKLEKLNIAYNE